MHVPRRTPRLAVDLGSARTRIYVRGRGVVLDEPSVVAVLRGSERSELLAVGEEARRMLGRTPESIQAVRPVQGGRVRHFELAARMLGIFLGRAAGRLGLGRPRVLLCAPHGADEDDRRALRECARAAGAAEPLLLDQLLAGALGAELPLAEPRGVLVLDVGAGKAEAGVLAYGSVVRARSLELGGDALDEAIQQWCRGRHGVLLGLGTAERVKVELGSARPPPWDHRLSVRGRRVDGGPAELQLSAREVAEALAPAVGRLLEGLRQLLAETPPELAADVLDSGLLLLGQGSQLRELDTAIREASGLPVVPEPHPGRSVVLGAGLALEDPALLARLLGELP